MKSAKQLRKEKHKLKSMADLILAGIPATCEEEGTRHDFIRVLLECAKGWPVQPDLAKAALELCSYNDRVAALLIGEVAKTDYRHLLQQQKEEERRSLD